MINLQLDVFIYEDVLVENIIFKLYNLFFNQFYYIEK